jgi:hypothetical protein
MSGQPIKTPTDANRFRNEYMEALNLQERINDMNLQANKTYLLTGQLPPQSQLQDTRTTAEKLKDVELLKHRIADALAPIAEPQFALAIVDRVIKSPLNVDNSLLRFLAQRASSIAEQLRQSYTFGIAGDANDLDIIVEFIRNMYADQQGKFQSTKSYFNSQSIDKKSSAIESNDIDNISIAIQELQKQMLMSQKQIPQPIAQPIADKFTRIGTILSTLKRVLPSTNHIRLLLEDINNPDYAFKYPEMGPRQRQGDFSSDELSAFFSIIEKLPKFKIMMTLIQKCQKFIKLSDWKNVESSLQSMLNELATFEQEGTLRILGSFQNIIDRQKMKEDDMRSLQETQTREFIQQQGERQRDASKATKVYVVNPETDPVFVSNGALAGIQQQQGAVPQPIQQPVPQPVEADVGAPQPGPVSRMPYIVEQLRDMPEEQLRDVIEAILQSRLFTNQTGRNQMYLDSLERLQMYATGRLNLPPQLVRQSIMTLLTANKDYDPSTVPPTRPLGVAGLGVTKKRRGRPIGSGISQYSPMGDTLVNKSKLKDGILTIRRKSKSRFADMPSKHISQKLQGVINTIIGGGMPKFEELNKLDEDEKNYLFKLVKKSNLEDRLTVPAPSKDQQEKDIHSFEVMKGQILAGNDSVELVKKFKLLIRKLAKQGLLPKADVEEMIETLWDLGH